jgi:hypothetical protein
MKSIHFKPLTESDLLLLHDWFQKSHVKHMACSWEKLHYRLVMIYFLTIVLR